MKAKRVTGMLLVSALAVSLFTGCGGGSSENEGGIKEFTAFFAVPGAEINDDRCKGGRDMAYRSDSF